MAPELDIIHYITLQHWNPVTKNKITTASVLKRNKTNKQTKKNYCNTLIFKNKTAGPLNLKLKLRT